MDVKETVDEAAYGEAALRVKDELVAPAAVARPQVSVCCVDPITSNLYASSQTSQIQSEER